MDTMLEKVISYIEKFLSLRMEKLRWKRGDLTPHWEYLPKDKIPSLAEVLDWMNKATSNFYFYHINFSDLKIEQRLYLFGYLKIRGKKDMERYEAFLSKRRRELVKPRWRDLVQEQAAGTGGVKDDLPGGVCEMCGEQSEGNYECKICAKDHMDCCYDEEFDCCKKCAAKMREGI